MLIPVTADLVPFWRIVVIAGLLTLAACDSPPSIPRDSGPATVTGTVRFVGEVPLNPIADNNGRRRPLLNVDAETRGLQYVVVYLEPLDERESSDAVAGANLPSILMDQEDDTFVPHLIAVRAGQPVTFTNSDIVNHNVRTMSFEPRNLFNVYTGTGAEHTHRFVADADHRPVRVGCDIHMWMTAWVYVFNHDRFAVTDATGKFEIKNVPPGRYRLTARQPDGNFTFERQITLSAGSVEVLEIRFNARNDQ